MTAGSEGRPPRRRALLGAGGLAALAAGGAALAVGTRDGEASAKGAPPAGTPFHGPHQAGILTPRRSHAHLAGFDLLPGVDRGGAVTLLKAWTTAAERMTRGESPGAAEADTGTALGAGPAGLTVTLAFGAGFFDRLGMSAARPEALAPLPAFPDDRLDPARGGGDLFLQTSADDPFVAVHALRALQRLTRGAAGPRWSMTGFTRASGGAGTHRNLMGQLDGTANPDPVADPTRLPRVLVTGPGAPIWADGGSYVVVRRIRMLLDHWEGLPAQHREQAVGRRVADGAPLTGGTEHTPVDLDAARPDGVPVIATNAHIRPAAPRTNSGATMLRRGWSFGPGPMSVPAVKLGPWTTGCCAVGSTAPTTRTPIRARDPATSTASWWAARSTVSCSTSPAGAPHNWPRRPGCPPR